MAANHRLIYGTMGLGGDWDASQITSQAVSEAELAIGAAMDIGIDTFDFADIYRKGRSEGVVGEIFKMNPSLRKQMKIQSKAGIILPHVDGVGRFDFSETHLVNTVQESVKRLHIQQMDTLLLHRPDPLMDRKELRKAIDFLFEEGLIQSLGVSNMNQFQIEWIQGVLERKIVANQLEMSLKKLDWLDATIGMNNDEGFKSSFTPGLMEYMEQHHIEIQAWSPLARGIYSGKVLDDPEPHVLETIKYVEDLAKEKKSSCASIVIAFLLKHPAQIRPVIGTSNPERIRELRDVEEVELTRFEWYRLYILSRNQKLP